MFIVKTGEFHATIHEDGREAILATFKTGDFFGEMSLLDGQSRSASVHAAKRGCLLRLAREKISLPTSKLILPPRFVSSLR